MRLDKSPWMVLSVRILLAFYFIAYTGTKRLAILYGLSVMESRDFIVCMDLMLDGVQRSLLNSFKTMHAPLS